MTLGENLKRHRQRRKLTADEAAALCGVSRASWFAYESGRETPTLARLLRMAYHLQTTASALLKGVEHQEQPNGRP